MFKGAKSFFTPPRPPIPWPAEWWPSPSWQDWVDAKQPKSSRHPIATTKIPPETMANMPAKWAPTPFPCPYG